MECAFHSMLVSEKEDWAWEKKGGHLTGSDRLILSQKYNSRRQFIFCLSLSLSPRIWKWRSIELKQVFKPGSAWKEIFVPSYDIGGLSRIKDKKVSTEKVISTTCHWFIFSVLAINHKADTAFLKKTLDMDANFVTVLKEL